MRYLFVLMLLWSTAFAKDKPQYQDGVLLDFHTVTTGAHCDSTGNTTGTVDATTTDDGSAADTSGTVRATTNTSTDCYNSRRRVFTVSVGGHNYTLEPYVNPGRVATAFVPILGPAYLIATKKNSNLYGLLPGTHVLVRTEEGGAFYVKVGKRETQYKLVGAN